MMCFPCGAVAQEAAAKANAAAATRSRPLPLPDPSTATCSSARPCALGGRIEPYQPELKPGGGYSNQTSRVLTVAGRGVRRRAGLRRGKERARAPWGTDAAPAMF